MLPLTFSFRCMKFHFFIVPLLIPKETICNNRYLLRYSCPFREHMRVVEYMLRCCKF